MRPFDHEDKGTPHFYDVLDATGEIFELVRELSIHGRGVLRDSRELEDALVELFKEMDVSRGDVH